VGGIIKRVNGTDDLTRTGGLWRAAPWLGILFLFQALSLAGLPPLSGFWGKFMIVQEGLSQGEWVLVTLSLVASVLTLLSMLKIWLGAFWRGEAAAPLNWDAGARRMTAVGLGMVVVSLCIGLGAPKVLATARHAAAEVLDRKGYVAAVYGANQVVYEGKQP
jgi:multicomponent Na+:H+ antiporter subunit D